MNSKYEYYNMIFSEYDEELKQSYEELSTCIKQLIKSPTIIDKIVILYMITEAYVELYTEVDQDNKTMSINELMEIINAILLYRTEEILADGTKEEYTKITSVSDFLSTFDNHYQNIITLKEKYPKLYKDIYDNSYYEELDIMNRREREMKNIAYIFENMDTI
ncbi:MAG: hypothetical protein LBH96_04360 [Candidatus Peribacteria bacterium]|jgi:hypothetical protein|nr:hypothetical protein [Candidatus Peribacteria bacterium]